MLYDINEITKYAFVNEKYLPILRKYMPDILVLTDQQQIMDYFRNIQKIKIVI